MEHELSVEVLEGFDWIVPHLDSFVAPANWVNVNYRWQLKVCLCCDLSQTVSGLGYHHLHRSGLILDSDAVQQLWVSLQLWTTSSPKLNPHRNRKWCWSADCWSGCTPVVVSVWFVLRSLTTAWPLFSPHDVLRTGAWWEGSWDHWQTAAQFNDIGDHSTGHSVGSKCQTGLSRVSRTGSNWQDVWSSSRLHRWTSST